MMNKIIAVAFVGVLLGIGCSKVFAQSCTMTCVRTDRYGNCTQWAQTCSGGTMAGDSFGQFRKVNR